MNKVSNNKTQENSVSAAFSAQSIKFDAITTSNLMEVTYRDIVREHVLHYTQHGQCMLELNCGTGLDAVFFAEKGLSVYATDNAEGMLAELRHKIAALKLDDKISFQKCSFNNLNELDTEQKFDHVFSNFGGLNCAENINALINELNAHLKTGSMVHFVMIAPVCLWEWLAVFKGRFKYAFRRLNKNGVKSHLEGHYFTTFYYSASFIKKAFGKNYNVVRVRSLGCFLPPTFKEDFPLKMPGMFRFLKAIELRVNTLWPFNRVGDLYIISLKKC